MVDIVGPLPSSYGYRFLLTAICRTTRNLQAIPLKEASSKEAAEAFLHHWASIWGLPSLVTSDNGASFSANLWKEMMDRLNIEVKYSALYRPESIGMLERQHQGIKNSLKAALIDMGETHQDRWLDFLPFVLLGRRVAYQPDLGASASELTFGKNVTIPGEILQEPDSSSDISSVKELLSSIKQKTDRQSVQPSRHSLPEPAFPHIPDTVTHVYTKQHQKTGLQAAFEGPFAVAERVSRSVWKIEVGEYKDGRKRYEYRHLNDLKFAHPKSLAAPAHRPKLGRPSTRSSSMDLQSSTEVVEEQFPSPSDVLTNRLNDPQPPEAVSVNKLPVVIKGNDATAQNINHETSIQDDRQPPSSGPPPVKPFSRPTRSTRNPNPVYVDAITLSRPWSASKDEIAELNRQISSP